ncbi:unnamed protein product [Spodoptera littoralis]|uniref:Uncharacterized protein n=1 Tax=Spodoptera littoralis TaxID=7109 RepID=A0A9P0I6G4_SPOLI|nr:unnamed protein product [Spodoptera littoralis]CAH1640643.1 unnamed protein product [Spodoptera littoralis]
MTSHEAIGWMRICRPGSVIGHQQGWLEELEPWLMKHGNIYRKRIYQDTEKFPMHEFGVYSIAEKTMKQRPVLFHKSPSPPPPIQKQNIRSETLTPVRPQNSRIKEGFNKTQEKEYDWHVKPQNLNTSQQKMLYRGDPYDSYNNVSRRSSGAGDPKASRPTSRNSVTRSQMPRESLKSGIREPDIKNLRGYTPITTFRTSQAPVIKSVNDARNYLMRSSIYNSEREKQLNSSVTVTPHYPYYTSRLQNQPLLSSPMASIGAHITPSSYSTGPKPPGQPQIRRRLGRSPSPPVRMPNDQSRATNTPSPTEKFLVKYASKSALKDVFSKLKFGGPVSMCRDGSLGAASLGATRDAPPTRRAPSVRSDERPLATQGDMLNSIKFQRRLRDTINAEKTGNFHEKASQLPKKPSIKNMNTRTTNLVKPNINQDYSGGREKQSPISRSFFSPARPMSPKGRRSPQTTSFY